MTEETSECLCINSHLQLNLNLRKTYLYEELHLFRKIVSQESLALNIQKFVFQNNLSKILPNIVTAYTMMPLIVIGDTSPQDPPQG